QIQPAGAPGPERQFEPAGAPGPGRQFEPAGAPGPGRQFKHGADVVIESNLPRGAGLASSAALTCAVTLALSDLQGALPERAVVAAVAQRAETDFVGVPVGRMDHLTVLHGSA